MDLNDIEKHIEGKKYTYIMNERYSLGENTEILKDPPKNSPDNRVPTAFAKLAIDTVTGYAAKPGSITYSYSGDNEEQVAEIMGEVYKWNDEPLTTNELYSEMLTHGKACELHFYTDDSDNTFGLTRLPEFRLVPSSEVYLQYSDSLSPKMEAAYYIPSTDEEDKIMYELLPMQMNTYIKKKKANKWSLENEIQTPYKTPNMVEYVGNRHKTSIWNPVKTLIDAHDKLISKATNEIDRFALAMLLLPFEADEEFVSKLNEMKVIDRLKENGENLGDLPKYLDRNIQDEFIQNMANRYERLIHKILQVPDFSDENFAGNTSGVAIQYKLAGLEFVTSSIDAYFDKGLQRRYELVGDVLSLSGINTSEVSQTINRTRNLPLDLMSLADTAVKLSPVLSRETVLKLFPSDVVDSVEEELLRLDQDIPAVVMPEDE